MTNEEAIKAIITNYPPETPENYSMLREALNKVIVSLQEHEPVKIFMSTLEEEWYGLALECTICGCRWMMSDDDDTCYCPHCGRPIKWDK